MARKNGVGGSVDDTPDRRECQLFGQCNLQIHVMGPKNVPFLIDSRFYFEFLGSDCARRTCKLSTIHPSISSSEVKKRAVR